MCNIIKNRFKKIFEIFLNFKYFCKQEYHKLELRMVETIDLLDKFLYFKVRL